MNNDNMSDTNVEQVPVDENPIDNVMTDFEKQYFKEGRPIYYVDAKFIN